MKQIRKIILITRPDSSVEVYANAKALWEQEQPGISIHAWYKGRGETITTPTGYTIEQREVKR